MARNLSVLALLIAAACGPSPTNNSAQDAAVRDRPASQGGLDSAAIGEVPPKLEPDLGNTPLVAGTEERLLVFDVRGMRCENCARGLWNDLQSAGGVLRVRVSFAQGRAWVLTRSETPDVATLVDHVARRDSGQDGVSLVPR